ncbi:hypothetical protein GCM10009639_56780 [Kitasatospora putterlickiae]|uniref:Uncharacterized protein n=1 Tax=Kitasatospora putterlickiae TaxID=221725 RepID=A0ABP4J2E9_9ACTN
MAACTVGGRTAGPFTAFQMCLTRAVGVPERFRGGLAPSAPAVPPDGGTPDSPARVRAAGMELEGPGWMPPQTRTSWHVRTDEGRGDSLTSGLAARRGGPKR